MRARILYCSCGWVVEQEHYDSEGKFLQIIRDIHLKTFHDHNCEIKDLAADEGRSKESHRDAASQ